MRDNQGRLPGGEVNSQEVGSGAFQDGVGRGGPWGGWV